MKKFEFRLQTALRWRNTQLKLERAKLQRLLNFREESNRGLQTLLKERNSASAGLADLKLLHSSDLRALSAYLMGADMRIQMLREKIAKMAVPIQQQQQCLLQAERNVRLLEELRENRYAEWKTELDKEIDLASEESWLAANFRTSDSEF